MYDKQMLFSLGKIASRNSESSGLPLTQTVSDVVGPLDLNSDQIERVVNAANQTTNVEMMKKEGYTSFPLAESSDVMDILGKGREDVAANHVVSEDFLLGFADGAQEILSKEASVSDSFFVPLEKEERIFSKIASLYGTHYQETGSQEEDAIRFVEAASVIIQGAHDSLTMKKMAMDETKDDAYQEVRKSLLSGMSPEDSFSLIAEERPEFLKPIADRLEAEGFLRPSEYDDAGPYSLDRLYKNASDAMVSAETPYGTYHVEKQMEQTKEFNKSANIKYAIKEGSLLDRSCKNFATLSKQASVDIEALSLSIGGLASLDSLYPNSVSSQTRTYAIEGLEKAAQLFGIPFTENVIEDLTKELNKEASAFTVAKSIGKGVTAPFRWAGGKVLHGLDSKAVLTAKNLAKNTPEALAHKATAKGARKGLFGRALVGGAMLAGGYGAGKYTANAFKKPRAMSPVGGTPTYNQ